MAEAITLKEYYEHGLNQKNGKKDVERGKDEDKAHSLGEAYYNAFEIAHDNKTNEEDIIKDTKGEIVKFTK